LVDYQNPVYGAQYNIANNYKVNIKFCIYKVNETIMKTVTTKTKYDGNNSLSSNDDDKILEFVLHGFFPKSINNPTYDYTTFEIVTRDVGFTFDYIELITPSLQTTTQGNQENPQK
jgi:hypothetical protein